MSEGNSDRSRARSSQLRPGENLERRVDGQQYRSRGERTIARLLNQCGIPFIYEKPIAVQDGGKTKIWYPDFYLSCGLVVEYFGIEGSHDYRKRTEHKLKVYARNGIPVVPVFPQDLKGAWQYRLLARIDRTLDKIVADYRGKVPPCDRGQEQSIYRAYLELR